MEQIYTTTMILSIAVFTFSSVMTPGPNNIMLLSSGLTFGYRRSIPHILGVMIGFTIMVIIVGLGMGVVFERFPFILDILKIVGITYLIWLAYKIANNKSSYKVEDNDEISKPFTFIQIAIFQWINPKAWIMAITSISIFITSTENNILQVLTVATLYLLFGMVSTNTWVLGGVLLKRFITNDRKVQIFNKIMALLLILSIVPFIFE